MCLEYRVWDHVSRTMTIHCEDGGPRLTHMLKYEGYFDKHHRQIYAGDILADEAGNEVIVLDQVDYLGKSVPDFSLLEIIGHIYDDARRHGDIIRTSIITNDTL